MQASLVRAVLGLLALLTASAAEAGWSPLRLAFYKMYLQSTPSCVNASANGVIHCAGRTNDGVVKFFSFSADGWQMSFKRDHTVVDPVCMAFSTGTLTRCYYARALDTLTFDWIDSENETIDLSSIIVKHDVKDIACFVVESTDGGAYSYCLWRSTNGFLYYADEFSAAERPICCTVAYSAPSCAPDDAGGAICSFLGQSNNALAVKWYKGGARSPVIDLQGKFSSPPTCTNVFVSGDVLCAGRGLDLRYYSNRYRGTGDWSRSSWTGWSPANGVFQSKPGCAGIGRNQLVCAGIDFNNSGMFVFHYEGGWKPGVNVGGKATAAPTCVFYKPGQAVCLVTSVLGHVYYTVGP